MDSKGDEIIKVIELLAKMKIHLLVPNSISYLLFIGFLIVSISHYNNNNDVMAFKPVPPPSPSIPQSDTNNLAPTANAGTNQIVNENTLVTLVGAGSDPNPDDIITYSWRQMSGPAVVLNDDDTSTPSFTAPSNVSSDTELVFSLTVSDDKGAHSNIARVSVTVKNINNAPTANAGIDQTANGGHIVSLDGTASTDPDNDQLSYTWTQTEGPIVVLNDPNSDISTFTAPSDLPEDTELVFSLTVKDYKGDESSSDTVNIIVKAKTTPSAKTTTTDEEISKDTTSKQEQTKSYQFIKAWGSAGDGEGEFSNIGGISIDTHGNVYVVDIPNHRIQKFDSNGKFIIEWGSEGEKNGEFDAPSGIAVDSSSGNVYVADLHNHRIQKFDSNGNFITKWGSKGTGEGQFDFPNITVDSSTGNVYVADANNHRIQKFDSNGNFITKWGSYGEGDGEMIIPHGIAVDSSSGNVYVSDDNYRIQVFAPSK